MEPFPKDPNAVLDWLFEWGNETRPWLETGETILTQTVTITGPDTVLTLDSSTIVDAAKNVLVFLSGGTAGTIYSVACLITTSESRTDERTLQIRVVER